MVKKNFQETLEQYFTKFKSNVIGNNQTFKTAFGIKEIVYADWTATARGYEPIENYIVQNILPFIGNTHTGNTVTGSLMSQAYEEARNIVKSHVGANEDDVLVLSGSGMTACINKLQRILGMRIPERLEEYQNLEINGNDPIEARVSERSDYINKFIKIDEIRRPVVFITHMEHHSNQVSWLETIADVEIIGSDSEGNVDLEDFNFLLEKYRFRKNKIAAVTACSNVTGIQTPYQQIAKMIHRSGGYCFVDFSCSAPYVHINMHPQEKDTHLDAIFFSGHKFLGGPSTPGVLIFNKILYNNETPDHPGGGTVTYTNPWKGFQYINNIEQREDGGTPPFVQTIKLAMCVRLKEEMGVENILQREKELLKIIFDRMSGIRNLKILEGSIKNRLGVISFMVTDAHYNLVVILLNDRFGVQTRGGCSCAGTYGHNLLKVDKKTSHEIFKKITEGDLSVKPGWVRLSIHPTMTNEEVEFILDAIDKTIKNYDEWSKDYWYDSRSNEFTLKQKLEQEIDVHSWFDPSAWNEKILMYQLT